MESSRQRLSSEHSCCPHYRLITNKTKSAQRHTSHCVPLTMTKQILTSQSNTHWAPCVCVRVCPGFMYVHVHTCMCTLECGGGGGGVKHTVVSMKGLFCSCRCEWEDAVEWGHLGPRILGELWNYWLCFQFQCKCWETWAPKGEQERGGHECGYRVVKRPENVKHDGEWGLVQHNDL